MMPNFHPIALEDSAALKKAKPVHARSAVPRKARLVNRVATNHPFTLGLAHLGAIVPSYPKIPRRVQQIDSREDRSFLFDLPASCRARLSIASKLILKQVAEKTDVVMLSPFARHSEPVRPPLANGPERSEGAQGKLREESASAQGKLREASACCAGTEGLQFFVSLRMTCSQPFSEACQSASNRDAEKLFWNQTVFPRTSSEGFPAS